MLNFKLNIEHLPSGVYLLTLKSTNNYTVNKRIVKWH